MRDLAAGSEIYHRPNSRAAPPSSSHFCGKRDGRGKIFRWGLFEMYGMEKEIKSMKTNDELEPMIFVIFGGAGDLTWRKLVPALFDLAQDRSVPAQFAIIAVGQIKFGDDMLRRRLRDGVNQFS